LLGKDITFDSPVIQSSIKSLNDSAEGGYYARQILRLAKGKKINANYSASISSLWLVFREMKKALIKK
jgi:hypothetical protein